MKTTYEVYLNGALADSYELEGLAYLGFESACLLGEGALIKIVDAGNPVLDGRYAYDRTVGGWRYQGPLTPPCPASPKECLWRKRPDPLPLQRNALRVEIIEPSPRCGWLLKRDRIGGHFYDYEPCLRK